jgi:hypothetical protein
MAVRARLALAVVALMAFAGLVVAARTNGPLTSPAGPAGPAGPAATADRTTLPGEATLAAPAAADPSGPLSPAALRETVAALDRARGAAFADPVDGDPDEWATTACPCHAVDADALRALADRRRALRGATFVLLDVALAPRARAPGRAVRARTGVLDLLVVDRLGPYVAVDARGRVVARWPGTGPRRWRIRLARVAGRWRIGSIARAP